VTYLVAVADGSTLGYVVMGAILQRYDDLAGPAGALGFPTADATSSGRQNFQNGALAGSPAQMVSGAILAKWASLGYDSKIAYTENNIYAIKATVDAALTKDSDNIRRYVRPEWGNPDGNVQHYSFGTMGVSNGPRAIEIYEELLRKTLAGTPNPETAAEASQNMSRIYHAMAAIYRRSGRNDLASEWDARRLALWCLLRASRPEILAQNTRLPHR